MFWNGKEGGRMGKKLAVSASGSLVTAAGKPVQLARADDENFGGGCSPPSTSWQGLNGGVRVHFPLGRAITQAAGARAEQERQNRVEMAREGLWKTCADT